MIACLSLLVGSCSDGEDNTGILNEPRITLSTWNVSFPGEGGIAVVAMVANRENVKIENVSWLTVTEEENQLTIIADANPDSQQRISQIILSVSDGGTMAKDSIAVVQSALGTIHLSETETANCYIVKTGGNYSFRADVKGNGGTDGKSKYISQYGLEIQHAVYADLLWEATYDADKNISRDIICGQPVYRDGEIHFSTGSVQGNAVIAVKDAYGTILWSWHIWVVDEEINSEEGGGLIWMDRNLGALNNTPGDINNRGLLYQWGRKDPFLPSRAAYMVTEFDNIAAANRYNNEVGDGSAQWNYNHPMRNVMEAPGNMEYAVRRPTDFLTSSSFENWFVTTEIETALWGADPQEKTIFDPCPAGYMVAPSEGWDRPTIKNDWGTFTDNGRYWTAGSNDFYPLSGFLQVKGGVLNYCGALGMYWTRNEQSESLSNGGRLYLASNSIFYSHLPKGSGLLVRCIKQ